MILFIDKRVDAVRTLIVDGTMMRACILFYQYINFLAYTVI